MYLVPTQNLQELLSTFGELPMSLSIKAFKGKETIPDGCQSLGGTTVFQFMLFSTVKVKIFGVT